MQEPLLPPSDDVELDVSIRNDWAVQRSPASPQRTRAERSPNGPLRRMHLQGPSLGAAQSTLVQIPTNDEDLFNKIANTQLHLLRTASARWAGEAGARCPALCWIGGGDVLLAVLAAGCSGGLGAALDATCPYKSPSAGNDMGAAWRLRIASEESARKFSIMLFLSTGFLIAEVPPSSHCVALPNPPLPPFALPSRGRALSRIHNARLAPQAEHVPLRSLRSLHDHPALEAAIPWLSALNARASLL